MKSRKNVPWLLLTCLCPGLAAPFLPNAPLAIGAGVAADAMADDPFTRRLFEELTARLPLDDDALQQRIRGSYEAFRKEAELAPSGSPQSVAIAERVRVQALRAIEQALGQFDFQAAHYHETFAPCFEESVRAALRRDLRARKAPKCHEIVHWQLAAFERFFAAVAARNWSLKVGDQPQLLHFTNDPAKFENFRRDFAAIAAQDQTDRYEDTLLAVPLVSTRRVLEYYASKEMGMQTCWNSDGGGNKALPRGRMFFFIDYLGAAIDGVNLMDLRNRCIREWGAAHGPAGRWQEHFQYELAPDSILAYYTAPDGQPGAAGDRAARDAPGGAGRIQFQFRVKATFFVVNSYVAVTGERFASENFATVERAVAEIAHDLKRAFAAGADTIPPPAPGANELRFESVESNNLKTRPGRPSTCKLVATVRDSRGHPVAGARVTFVPPKLGQLSKLAEVTNAVGQAEVTYASPAEDELAATGQKEVELSVFAQVPGPEGVLRDQVQIHVRSQTALLAATVLHPILPAVPRYRNAITFECTAANKPDASPYRAVVRIMSPGGHGTLTEQEHQAGGARRIELSLHPRQARQVYYRWTGPPTLRSAYQESIAVEIPELQQQTLVAFSVGVDLEIVAVLRKYKGPMYQLLPEPFRVIVRDRLHPAARLEDLFEDLRLSVWVEVAQASFEPLPIYDPEKEFFSTLLSYVAESAKSVTVIPHSVLATVKPDENHWVLVSQTQDEAEHLRIDYPRVTLFARGTYQFKVSLQKMEFDGDPRNNEAVTETFTTEDYSGMGEELFHTAVIPMTKFLVGVAAGADSVTALPALQKSLQAIQVFQSELDFVDAIRRHQWKNAVVVVWDIFSGGLDADKLVAAGQLTDFGKRLLQYNALSLYLKTLDEELDKFEQTIDSLRAKGTAPRRAPDAGAVCSQAAQLSLKGLKKHYVVLLERAGLAGYQAALAGGPALVPAPVNPVQATEPGQRLRVGKRFVVIPAGNDESLQLKLTGTGTGGRLILVRPEAVQVFDYPPGSWQAELRVGGDGRVTLGDGAAIPWRQGSLPPLEPPSPPAPAPRPPVHPDTPPPAPATTDYQGRWDTPFGTLNLTVADGQLHGTYARNRGQIEGVFSPDGKTATGRWAEAPSYEPPRDAGRFVLRLSEDGQVFSGRYGFGDQDPQVPWQGKRLSR